MSGTLLKLISIALTACVAYQVYYNYKANEELGGKYQDLSHTIYGWVSLLPGVALGTFVTRLSFAENDERANLLAKRCMYDVCAAVYLFVAFIMATVFVYTKVHVQHQNPGWQYIHSKWSSMNFNVYYFGVLQYGPALLLTTIYRANFGRLFKAQKETTK